MITNINALKWFSVISCVFFARQYRQALRFHKKRARHLSPALFCVIQSDVALSCCKCFLFSFKFFKLFLAFCVSNEVKDERNEEDKNAAQYKQNNSENKQSGAASLFEDTPHSKQCVDNRKNNDDYKVNNFEQCNYLFKLLLICSAFVNNCNKVIHGEQRYQHHYNGCHDGQNKTSPVSHFLFHNCQTPFVMLGCPIWQV